jgi:hypothetical protein
MGGHGGSYLQSMLKLAAVPWFVVTNIWMFQTANNSQVIRFRRLFSLISVIVSSWGGWIAYTDELFSGSYMHSRPLENARPKLVASSSGVRHSALLVDAYTAILCGTLQVYLVFFVLVFWSYKVKGAACYQTGLGAAGRERLPPNDSRCKQVYGAAMSQTALCIFPFQGFFVGTTSLMRQLSQFYMFYICSLAVARFDWLALSVDSISINRLRWCVYCRQADVDVEHSESCRNTITTSSAFLVWRFY